MTICRTREARGRMLRTKIAKMQDMKRLAADLLLPLAIAAVAIAIKTSGFSPLEAVTLGSLRSLSARGATPGAGGADARRRHRRGESAQAGAMALAAHGARRSHRQARGRRCRRDRLRSDLPRARPHVAPADAADIVPRRDAGRGRTRDVGAARQRRRLRRGARARAGRDRQRARRRRRHRQAGAQSRLRGRPRRSPRRAAERSLGLRARLHARVDEPLRNWRRPRQASAVSTRMPIGTGSYGACAWSSASPACPTRPFPRKCCASPSAPTAMSSARRARAANGISARRPDWSMSASAGW